MAGELSQYSLQDAKDGMQLPHLGRMAQYHRARLRDIDKAIARSRERNRLDRPQSGGVIKGKLPFCLQYHFLFYNL
jgi:hypothetical protein